MIPCQNEKEKQKIRNGLLFKMNNKDFVCKIRMYCCCTRVNRVNTISCREAYRGLYGLYLKVPENWTFSKNDSCSEPVKLCGDFDRKVKLLGIFERSSN